MYKEFFGLRDNPFNVNPDPRYLFFTTQTQAALDELTYGIQARNGLLLLTGEVGTGKTTLINKLLECLHQRGTPTAFIFNSHLETNHLFDFILADFGLPFDHPRKESSLLRLNQWLIDRYRSGGETPVLIVDEAQGLPLHVLEEIRMLLNLETPHHKLLQIVLAGQPELEERLRRPELRQLKQRIMLRCKTAALTLDETHDYVQSRLHTAGADGKPIFSPEAVDALHFYSRGIPRVVNLLCEHGLINAYADNVKPVSARIIREIAREFQFEDFNPLAVRAISSDALTSKLIEIQSALANALSRSPISEAIFLQDDASSRISHSSAPMDNSENEVVPDEETAILSSADLLTQPNAVPAEFATETSHPSASFAFPSTAGVQCVAEMLGGMATISSLPQLHIVESKPRPREDAISSDAQASNPKNADRHSAAVDAAPTPARAGWTRVNASGASLAVRLVKWKTRLSFAAASLEWAQINAHILQRVKRSRRSAQTYFRASLAWLNKGTTVLASRTQVGSTAPLSRWLLEPWTPTLPALPGLRSFAMRRKLTHKKI